MYANNTLLYDDVSSWADTPTYIYNRNLHSYGKREAIMSGIVIHSFISFLAFSGTEGGRTASTLFRAEQGEGGQLTIRPLWTHKTAPRLWSFLRLGLFCVSGGWSEILVV